MSDSNIQKLDKEEEAQEQELTVAQKFWRIFEKLGDLFFLNIFFTILCT